MQACGDHVLIRRRPRVSWTEFSEATSGKKPADIPTQPHKVYANDDWAGIGDWLGTGRVARGHHRAFKKARAWVRKLGLKSHTEWLRYCKSGKKPIDIPSTPDAVYAHDGWAGYGDWLGTGRIADRLREYRPFNKARAFVRSLGLKSSTAWQAYCSSGKKPADISGNPNVTYANDGWAGFGDWLGTGRVGRGQHRSFKKARAFVRGLGLQSAADWRDYCKSGKKPGDIPFAPHAVYAHDGWAGYSDWLGCLQ